jgi:hypothetical protein
MLNEINDQFAPLMKQFSVYNFWEMLETEDGDDRMYIVDQDSAAPVWDNVEKCGIMGTHSTMAKFESNRDKRFRPLLEAICRFAKAAPTLIRTRWVNEKISISRERQQQAEELLRPQIQLTNADDAGYQDFNQWCMVPRRPSMYFTGRQKHAKTVRDMLGPVERVQNRKNNIVFVIYGLGGSGKTQFCLKYVEDNKHKHAFRQALRLNPPLTFVLGTGVFSGLTQVLRKISNPDLLALERKLAVVRTCTPACTGYPDPPDPGCSYWITRTTRKWTYLSIYPSEETAIFW